MKFIRGISGILYHVGIVILSAAIALSLPLMMSFFAKKFLSYWALIENEKMFLVSVEVGVAVLLIAFFSYTAKALRDRRYFVMARTAGLEFVSSRGGIFRRKKVTFMKKQHGLAKDVLIMGSTGMRTFVDAGGELHEAVKNCREAKVMLLDPASEGAVARARSLRVPGMSPETLSEQIMKSIGFLKGLRTAQKRVRLKLYPDMPLMKLSILGDVVSVRHYHTGLDVGMMPEYVFRHTDDGGGLYSLFYQYFLARWTDPRIPEYDLETDELVYRDKAGTVRMKSRFGEFREDVVHVAGSGDQPGGVLPTPFPDSDVEGGLTGSAGPWYGRQG